jgi:hypothetical protein
LRKRPLLSDVAEFPLARATRRDFDETLIQSITLEKEKEVVNSAPFFSKRWRVPCRLEPRV